MMGNQRWLLEQDAIKARSISSTLGRLAEYFKPFWMVMVGVLALMVLNAYVQVITPELTGQAVDCYLTPGITAMANSGAGGMATGAGEASAAASNCWFDTVPTWTFSSTGWAGWCWSWCWPC
jgi:ATP-binding cassette subfamily B protein